MNTLLGVNIDHVATLRQARRESFPDPLALAMEAIKGGANGITAHLREDRRHIQDHDIQRLKDKITVPLNMEMSIWPDIVVRARKIRPEWVCLVPERREELTTEGGLNVLKEARSIGKTVHSLHQKGLKISLFIEPALSMVHCSKELGVEAIEIHTGAYARAFRKSLLARKRELKRIRAAALTARQLGLLVNAGHGIDYENVSALSRIFPFHEFNIGFAIVSRSLKVGMKNAVKEMKEKIRNACVES